MPNLLNKTQIKSQLNLQNIHADIFDEINSTNEFLKNKQKSAQIQVCIAEMQTEGRGRLQREWYSPFGENIYLSLRCTIDKKFSELGGLSIITGLSICEILKNIPNVMLKWPNDVYVDGKKIAGCLIELQNEVQASSDIIIGLGLNVNMDHADLDQVWASIKTITGKTADRNGLIIELINELIKNISIFEAQGLVPFLEFHQAHDYLLNKTVNLSIGNKKYQGVAKGLNAAGHLGLLIDNQLQYFSSGEASLRA